MLPEIMRRSERAAGHWRATPIVPSRARLPIRQRVVQERRHRVGGLVVRSTIQSERLDKHHGSVRMQPVKGVTGYTNRIAHVVGGLPPTCALRTLTVWSSYWRPHTSTHIRGYARGGMPGCTDSRPGGNRIAAVEDRGWSTRRSWHLIYSPHPAYPSRTPQRSACPVALDPR